MGSPDKVQENRVRRLARRQGLALVRSRRRDHRALDFGTYGVMDPDHKIWRLTTSNGYGFALGDVEEWLTRRAVRLQEVAARRPRFLRALCELANRWAAEVTRTERDRTKHGVNISDVAASAGIDGQWPQLVALDLQETGQVLVDGDRVSITRAGLEEVEGWW